MKQFLIYLFMVGSCLSIVSCTKDELSSTAAPQPNVLSSSASEGTVLALTQDNADALFSDLSWTAVEFNGRSVKYSIELDKAGNNFMSARDIFTTDGLGTSFKVKDINAALINFGVSPGETMEVEIRVRSWVDYIITPAVSNSFKFTLTPYLLTFPPIYLIGDAQAWSLDNAVELTSTTPGVYSGQASFINNGKFRFFTDVDWSSQQYGWSYFTGGTIPNSFGSGEDSDSNFLFGGTGGDYIVTVSLPNKTITLELAGPPPPPASVFFVTAQTFDLATAVELTRDDGGNYVGLTMLDADTKFRIFLTKEWSSEKWSFQSFDIIGDQLANSGDDVSNLLFTGTTGWYEVSVSLDNKSISVTVASAPQEKLYLIGDPQGWSLDNAWKMRSLGNNTFEVVGTFATNQIFRFFVDPDWNADQYRWSSFTSGTVDGDLVDGGGGDSNFKFAAASGVYKITVSLNDKVIAVDPADTPTLYIIGDDQGWNLGNAVNMTWLGAGKFQATTTFTNNSIFRFFETADWAGVQWRYSSFANGTIDSEFQDGGGSDSNFRFAGTTGSHTVTVDINALTVDIQ